MRPTGRPRSMNKGKSIAISLLMLMLVAGCRSGPVTEYAVQEPSSAYYKGSSVYEDWSTEKLIPEGALNALNWDLQGLVGDDVFFIGFGTEYGFMSYLYMNEEYDEFLREEKVSAVASTVYSYTVENFEEFEYMGIPAEDFHIQVHAYKLTEGSGSAKEQWDYFAETGNYPEYTGDAVIFFKSDGAYDYWVGEGV
jgi:hypothetical protein